MVLVEGDIKGGAAAAAVVVLTKLGNAGWYGVVADELYMALNDDEGAKVVGSLLAVVVCC